MKGKLPLIVSLFVLGGLASLLFAAASGGGTGQATVQKRELFLSAVEWKGSASVAKEPYPGPVPPGGGYESCPPGSQECDLKGDPNKWAVETYRFDTAVVAACVGERVVLNIFGVNAATHEIVIPAFDKRFTVKRGVVSRIDLGVMKKPGMHTMLCITHPPAHRADLLVLPKGSCGR